VDGNLIRTEALFAEGDVIDLVTGDRAGRYLVVAAMADPDDTDGREAMVYELLPDPELAG
jgi:hypothetical protein